MAGFPRYNGHGIARGLVFDRQFLERSGSGNFDLAGAAKDSISGATWVTNTLGPALRFAAGTAVDTVTMNTAQFGQTKLSIEVLIHPTANPDGTGRILHKNSGGSSASRWMLFMSGTNAVTFSQGFNGATTDDWATASNTLPFNVPTHIVVTMDMNGVIGTSPTIYLNGINRTVTNSTVGAGTANSDTANLYVGNRSATDRDFVGDIYYVRIWSRKLAAQEAAALYNDPGIIYRRPAPVYSDVPAGGTVVTGLFLPLLGVG